LHEHVAVHSPEQEKDPCHRFLFHGDKEKGCSHKLHITKADKCKLCHVIFHNDHLTISEDVHRHTQDRSQLAVSGLSTFVFNNQILFSPRAPPVA
jgi:hypothetical protein